MNKANLHDQIVKFAVNYLPILGSERQAKAIIWAILLAIIGTLLFFGKINSRSDTPPFHIFDLTAVVFFGAAGSVFATAVTLRLLDPYNSDKAIEEAAVKMWGISYFGLPDGPSTSWWDDWINRAKSDSEIIIIGIQNTKWITKRYDPLLAAANRGCAITIVFYGTAGIIDENISRFSEMLKRWDSERCTALKVNIKRDIIPASADLPDFGYFWNGESLIVKANLPREARRNSPMMVYTSPVRLKRFDHEFVKEHIKALSPHPFATFLNEVANTLRRIQNNS